MQPTSIIPKTDIHVGDAGAHNISSASRQSPASHSAFGVVLFIPAGYFSARSFQLGQITQEPTSRSPRAVLGTIKKYILRNI
jgi:hypothetical protein